MTDTLSLLQRIERIEYLAAQLRSAVGDENIIFARLVILRNEVHDATISIFDTWPGWKQKGKAQASPEVDMSSVMAALVPKVEVDRRF